MILQSISSNPRPASRGAFLCFLHIKKPPRKNVVANFILPLILQSLGAVLFDFNYLLMLGRLAAAMD